MFPLSPAVVKFINTNLQAHLKTCYPEGLICVTEDQFAALACLQPETWKGITRVLTYDEESLREQSRAYHSTYEAVLCVEAQRLGKNDLLRRLDDIVKRGKVVFFLPPQIEHKYPQPDQLELSVFTDYRVVENPRTAPPQTTISES